MTPEHRAKQFAPFAAITGLDRAIDEKRGELNYCERREFSEEHAAELDEKLHALQVGMRVSVGYYAEREYRSLSGLVKRIDPIEQLLRIGSEQIAFGDIAEIILPQALPFSPERGILFPGDVT